MPYRSRKNSTRLFALLFLGVLLSAIAFSWLLLSSSLFIPHPSATQVLSGDPQPIVIPQLTPPSPQPTAQAAQAQEIVATIPTEAELAVPLIEQTESADQLAAANLPATPTNSTAPEGILGKKATAEPEIAQESASEVDNTQLASSQSDTLQASPETTIAVTPELTAEPETAATERALANTVELPIPEQTTAVSEPEPEPTESVPEPEPTESVPEPEPTESVPEPEPTESVPEPESTAESIAEPVLIAEDPPAELPTEVALAETETPVASEAESTTAESEPLAADTAVAANTGWIYAGQFRSGQWITSGLQLDKNTEPVAGESYPLTWGANVRAAPPGQRSSTDDPVKLAETIATIPVGNTIKVVQVKYSGNNGHIWLEIAY